MTGDTGSDTTFFEDVGKAHYALVGSALVLLHSGVRVLAAAGGSGDGALALIAVLDPGRLVLTSAVQIAASLVLPLSVAFAFVGLARRGHRLPAVMAAFVLLPVAALFGSVLMALLLTFATLFLVVSADRFPRFDGWVDRPWTLWPSVTLSFFLFIGSALQPVRPLEIIEISGQPPFAGRVYGEHGGWQLVQIGPHGPVRYVAEGDLVGREICQGDFNVLSGTVSDALRASGYRLCP